MLPTNSHIKPSESNSIKLLRAVVPTLSASEADSNNLIGAAVVQALAAHRRRNPTDSCSTTTGHQCITGLLPLPRCR